MRHLHFNEELHSQDARVPRVYFPTSGYVSLIAQRDEARLEVMLVGFEGVVGAQAGFGVSHASTAALVQCDGEALCFDSAVFLSEVRRSAALCAAVQRYSVLVTRDIATSAVCAQRHLLSARLARWLLMAQDRSRSPQLRFTHTFLSDMLGVRRVGVTNAATELQRRGLIRYTRGDVTILDRPGLLGAACSCYAGDQEAYAAIMRSRRAGRRACPAAAS